MAVKLADVVKDAKAAMTAGLAVVALWIGLTPVYSETYVKRTVLRELSTFLLLKDLLAKSTPLLYIKVGEDTLPPKRAEVVNPRSTVESDIEVCEARRSSTLCERLQFPDPEHNYEPHPLQFHSALNSKRVLTDADEVRGYYTITSPVADDPVTHYGVVLTVSPEAIEASTPKLPWETPAAGTVLTPDALAELQTALDPAHGVPQSHAAFAKLYRLKIVRSDLATTFHPWVGGESPDIIDSLKSAVFGESVAERSSRVPMYWPQLLGMLNENGFDGDDIESLQFSSAPTQKLMARYVVDQASYDIGGLKVPLETVPWAGSLILALLSCVLTGSWASLRRVEVSIETDDAGWVLLQSRRIFGLGPTVASALLIAIATTSVGYAAWGTIALLQTMMTTHGAALVALIVSLGGFAVMSGLTVNEQLRLSRRFVLHADGPSGQAPAAPQSDDGVAQDARLRSIEPVKSTEY